ncbi:glycosyltransferase family 8 protein [Butyrivibrio sp. NC2002]|uniref:glycosyltransferase family 8 protein n=1 Tax=Butyrivibrio sp. NC2002 TaxID=1410610 RepID=UPI00055B2D4F|nr:glycosyltransferase family 8 protein [Butyrivibrio sp. NC2002]
MTVVYVSDDNYAHLLGISLLSLYASNVKDDEINVFIIDDGISQSNKEKIKRTSARYGREVKFYNANLSISIYGMGKWPANIFYRLFFLTILGDELRDDRVLYLDCDTIITDRITELINIDLEGNACAAVYECMSKMHKRNCCLDDSWPYYNSGVLLMDVKKWRELEVEKRVGELIDLNHEKKMEYPDEGIINYVLKGKIKTLAPRYNLTTIKCVFSYQELKLYRKSRFMYNESDYDDAKIRPCIIHFTNSFLVRRPWQNGVGHEHPMVNYYLKFKNDSEWKEMKAADEQAGAIKKLARVLFSFNGIFCTFFTGVIYSYIKPLKYDVMIVSKD